MKDENITLARARVLAELTQEELAEKMHTSKSVISKWENGKSNISFCSLFTFATMCGVSVDRIKL